MVPTESHHLLEIGLIADMVENDQPNENANLNHLIPASDAAAFRAFMRSMHT